jgi:hypothetical protein
MKRQILILVLAFSIILITGCSSKITSNKTNFTSKVSISITKAIVSKTQTAAFPYELIPSGNVKKVLSIGNTVVDYNKSYDSLKEIVKVSDYIFDGIVTKVSYFQMGGITYTLYSINVINVYAGDIKVDDSVDVVEPGGYKIVYDEIKQYGTKGSPSGMTEEEQKNSYVGLKWDGCPLTNVGDSLFLCANKMVEDKSVPTPLNVLFPIGYNNGKFYIDDTKISRKYLDHTISSLEDNKVSFIKNIQQYISENIANK